MLSRRLLLALAALLLATLVMEGALSLFAGMSLRGSRAPAQVGPPAPITDAERHAGANSGYYEVHEDPLVRYTLRPEAELRFGSGLATTDTQGMRVRPGPPPPDGAQRLVVLGDSVAFGFGVADDQTLAVDLERVLSDSRGPDARPLACYTVATPSWNHRCALHYLADHWDELHPDIVVDVPVPNDLSDANDVYESGMLRRAPDPTSADPWLLVSRSQLASVEASRSENWKDPPLGPCALEADLSPESSRRYDENAASIVALYDMLLARGARFLLIQSNLLDYTFHLDSRIRRLRPELPILLIERFVPDSARLPGDMHPNADTIRSRAITVAGKLLELGFVDAGAGGALPEQPKGFQSLLARPSDLEAMDARSEKTHAEDAAALRPAIDLRTGEGFRQVFGGLNLDGSLRMHLLALLAATGDALHVRLTPLPGPPDAYPLAVDVDIDGMPVGTLQVLADGPCGATLPLPAALARSGKPVEVRLRPASWVVVQDRGRSEVASCFVVRLDAGVLGR